VEMARRDDRDVSASHSVEEAEHRHLAKRGPAGRTQTAGGAGGAKKRSTSSSA
jgi:hypothetical protein